MEPRRLINPFYDVELDPREKKIYEQCKSDAINRFLLGASTGLLTSFGLNRTLFKRRARSWRVLNHIMTSFTFSLMGYLTVIPKCTQKFLELKDSRVSYSLRQYFKNKEHEKVDIDEMKSLHKVNDPTKQSEVLEKKRQKVNVGGSDDDDDDDVEEFDMNEEVRKMSKKQ